MVDMQAILWIKCELIYECYCQFIAISFLYHWIVICVHYTCRYLFYPTSSLVPVHLSEP